MICIGRRESPRREIFCLGIESTAHTFSCSVAKLREGLSGEILSNVKAVYNPPAGSGIHPREASKHHSQIAAKIVSKALEVPKVRIQDIDAVAYSAGPGLGPCLRIGAVAARSLASYCRKPIVPVNHAVGHIELTALLTGARDPVVLLVSGGHTVITAYTQGRWRVFGETLDLTVGQLLDQFGREAGFSSPSGAKIEKLAEKSTKFVPLPYSVKGNDVSFSGILTAAKKLLRAGARLEDLCFSIQEVSFAMLAEVTERALAFCEKPEVMLTGGVAANKRLLGMLEEVAKLHSARFHVVPIEYSGDCGAQIAWTGALAYSSGATVPIERSVVRQSWRLDQVDVGWRS